MVRIIARSLWVVSVLLLLLSLNQGKVSLDLRTTWEEGEQLQAEITEWERSNRADVTYGYVSLRVHLENGEVLVKDKLSLPYSLLPRLEEKDSISVHVLEGAAQEVVIDQLMPAHWLIAASQFGMSLLGALMLGVGAFFWNSYLRKKARAK